MDQQYISLTVFFEGPFWVGIFERAGGGALQASRIVFGAEPKDQEVLEYITGQHRLKYSPAVADMTRTAPHNPKRRQREAAKAVTSRGISTKSQMALAYAREEHKLAARRESSRRRREEQDQRFASRQQKRKEKHRGH